MLKLMGKKIFTINTLIFFCLSKPMIIGREASMIVKRVKKSDYSLFINFFFNSSKKIGLFTKF